MIKELIVPIGVLIALASMILPLPVGAIDFLLIGNLVIAFLLLVNAMYVSEPLKLSSLPTMLLLATLFRLSLNVSTTRMILGTGDAGRAVEAFGSVVIGGNLVVGLVVFLVITLVQFIVIAKGAERVAEVAARFTLDALPGKQMAIDADVRAGQIDFETARQRRQDLQTESRFYGALDGAMKFVKGDAIAGLVVIAINIIGGIAVGLLLHDLDIGEAANKFTVLTIGDGLLSQIPALLNSLAAGMVVTRVAKGDGASLARELLSQIGQIKRVKIMVGAISIILAVVPGMPKLPLITLGIMLIVSGLMDRAEVKTETKSTELKFEPKIPAALEVAFSKDLGRELVASGKLLSAIEKSRQNIYNASGLFLKIPELTVVEEDGVDWCVALRGVRVAKGTKSGDTTADLAAICSAFERVVCKHKVELIDDMMTRRKLDHFEKESPELVSAVVPGIVSVTQLTELLKGLVREDISIRNFDIILQAVAEFGAKAGSERALLEEVRIALRRVFVQKYQDKDGVVNAITVEPAIDLAISKVETENAPLNMDIIQHVADSVASNLGNGVILLVSRKARALIKECLDIRGVKIAVLAHDELHDEIEFKSVLHITLRNEQLEEQIIQQLAA